MEKERSYNFQYWGAENEADVELSFHMPGDDDSIDDIINNFINFCCIVGYSFEGVMNGLKRRIR